MLLNKIPIVDNFKKKIDSNLSQGSHAKIDGKGVTSDYCSTKERF